MSSQTSQRGGSPLITSVGVMNLIFGAIFIAFGLYILLASTDAVALLLDVKQEVSSAGSTAGVSGEQTKQVGAGLDILTRGLGAIILAMATVAALGALIQGLPLLLVGLGVYFRRPWARILAMLFAVLAGLEGGACLLSVGQSSRFLVAGLFLVGYAVLTFVGLLGRRASREFSGQFEPIEETMTVQPAERLARMSPLTLGLSGALVGSLALACVLGAMYLHARNAVTEVSSSSAVQRGNIVVKSDLQYAQHLAELHAAAEKGQVSQVADMCKGNFSVDDKDENGETALMKASAKGNTKMVIFLIALGADANEKDSKSQTPLMRAAENGRKEIADVLTGARDIQPELLRLRAELNPEQLGAAFKDPGKLLGDAGSASLVPKVSAFKFAPADKAARDQEGHTAAMKAFLNRHYELANSLLGDGFAELLGPDKKGNNIFHLAAARGEVDAFTRKVLATDGIGQAILWNVPVGSLANFHNDRQQTPWMVAAANGHVEIARLLLDVLTDKKPWLDMKDADGNNALNLAAAGGHRDMVNFVAPLMGIDPATVKVVTPSGEPGSKGSLDPAARSLFQAIETGELDTMRELLATSAISPLARDDQGRTALMKSVIKGDARAVLLLTSFYEKGASADYLAAKDREGRTALMMAVEDDKTDVAEALLLAARGGFEAGKLNWVSILVQKDKSGKNAPELAKAKDRKKTAEMMENFIRKHLNDRSPALTESFTSQNSGGGTIAENSVKSALEYASSTGDLAVVEALLQWGAHKNHQFTEVWKNPHTALSMAAKNGHVLVVKALLDSFTKVDEMKGYLNQGIRGIPGDYNQAYAASYYAAANKHGGVVALLQEYAAK